jgi:NADH-quinone oxidoreductase subunit D
MTTSYVRIGGVRADLHPEYGAQIDTALLETRKVLKDVHGLLDKNKIFLNRTRDVAVMSREDAIAFGWTGPCLRSTGVLYDVRKAQPYLVYGRLAWDVPLGERGDNFDRYMVRMLEMEQSLRIVEQCVGLLPKSAPGLMAAGMPPAEAIAEARSQKSGRPIALSPNLVGSEKAVLPEIMSAVPGADIPPKEETYTSIEGLITHFKFFMKGHGIRPPKGETYFAVEGGNGELGYFVVSDGTDKPYRLHLRGPCFHIVAALESLIKGRMVADVIPTFGSMNMIGGELDR